MLGCDLVHVPMSLRPRTSASDTSFVETKRSQKIGCDRCWIVRANLMDVINNCGWFSGYEILISFLSQEFCSKWLSVWIPVLCVCAPLLSPPQISGTASWRHCVFLHPSCYCRILRNAEPAVTEVAKASSLRWVQPRTRHSKSVLKEFNYPFMGLNTRFNTVVALESMFNNKRWCTQWNVQFLSDTSHRLSSPKVVLRIFQHSIPCLSTVLTDLLYQKNICVRQSTQPEISHNILIA